MDIESEPPSWDVLLAELRINTDFDRSYAAREAIARFADESWLPRLHDLLANDENFYICESAATPIIRLEGLRALPSLLIALERGEREGHYINGFSLEVSELVCEYPAEAIPILEKMLDDPNPRRREDAQWLLEFAYDPL